MPDVIRRTGSWFVLGTYVTTIALGVTFFFGKEVLSIHDDRAEQSQLVKSVYSIEEHIKKCSKSSEQTRLDVHEHHILISAYEERLNKCEEHLHDLHGVKKKDTR